MIGTRKIQRLSASSRNLQNTINDDILFVIGRNIYQAASGGSRAAEEFIRDFVKKTAEMEPNTIGALLDGMLFEIFFDSKGELRANIKGNMFDDVFELQQFKQFKKSFDFIAQTLMATHARFFTVPGKGQTLSVSVATKDDKKGKLITGIFIDAVNVFQVLDEEYAEEEGKPAMARTVSKEGFEAQLVKDLVVPQRLLEVRYTPKLERDDVLRYPYGWGVMKP
jgi:hypothetical protein